MALFAAFGYRCDESATVQLRNRMLDDLHLMHGAFWLSKNVLLFRPGPVPGSLDEASWNLLARNVLINRANVKWFGMPESLPPVARSVLVADALSYQAVLKAVIGDVSSGSDDASKHTPPPTPATPAAPASSGGQRAGSETTGTASSATVPSTDGVARSSNATPQLPHDRTLFPRPPIGAAVSPSGTVTVPVPGTPSSPSTLSPGTTEVQLPLPGEDGLTPDDVALGLYESGQYDALQFVLMRDVDAMEVGAD